jgi:hypothetical protein
MSALYSHLVVKFVNYQPLDQAFDYNDRKSNYCTEARDIAIDTDLLDKYIFDASDLVNYALGDADGYRPIGVFILGTNKVIGGS